MERQHKNHEFKSIIFDEMSSPVLFFDETDALLFGNQEAAERGFVVEHASLWSLVEKTNMRYMITPERRRMGLTKEMHVTVNIGGKIYMAHGKEIWDDLTYEGMFIVFDDITDLENIKSEATYYATHDKLTGLWNQDYFYEMASKELRENPNIDYVMVSSDIAQFKLFNEILGFRAGNELLFAIAESFHKINKEHWIFSRIAGDRFALLMPKADFCEADFLDYCKKVLSHSSYSLHVHCYFGVYEITDHRMEPELIYNRSFLALESIKGDLNKTIAYYDEKIRVRRMAEHLTIGELEHALKADEFVIWFQPQVDTRTGGVLGAETLVRWFSPKRGMVPPSEFVPLFEKNGMITKMDYHIWKLACRQLAAWKEQGYTDRSLSINISAKNFYLSDLYERITGLVEEYQISPHLLRLEITESAFVLDVVKQMQLVRRLQEYGFLVEMDDFGSGYSSLNSLKDISTDVMKLDMGFFKSTDDSKRAEQVVKSMVGLATSLSTPIIAEGVENQEQIDFLQSVGCYAVQGYYCAKPMPLAEYEEYLSQKKTAKMEDLIRELKEKE